MCRALAAGFAGASIPCGEMMLHPLQHCYVHARCMYFICRHSVATLSRCKGLTLWWSQSTSSVAKTRPNRRSNAEERRNHDANWQDRFERLVCMKSSISVDPARTGAKKYYLEGVSRLSPFPYQSFRPVKLTEFTISIRRPARVVVLDLLSATILA